VVAFDRDVARELADEFLVLAEKQAMIVPLVIGHRMVAFSSLVSGEMTDALSHYEWRPPSRSSLARPPWPFS
jgi:hypothetical protein